LQSMHDIRPDCVLLDQRAMSTLGNGIHRTKSNDSRLKHIPFVIMSDVHEGQLVLGDGRGATDYFLKRPIPINLILDRIANSISEKVENGWRKLPRSAHQALRKSSDQFNDIAKSIAFNQPLDRSQITASCNPLVDCVKENQHKHILQGLKDHHNFTYVHSMRVAVFMSVFAQVYDFSKDEMVVLATGGYLHDVGMMMMTQNVLNKSEEITDGDWLLLQGHVNHSREIVRSIHAVNPVIKLVAEQHHERLDGSGYPHGLQGAKINEVARMAAIADVFAGLTDERPYRQAIDVSTAFSIMDEMSGALDQRLLRLFRDIISS